MTDGATPDYFEVTNHCEISGCFALLAGDYRCTEHGGHPTMESHADVWGSSGWTVDKQQELEQEGVTQSE